MTTSPSSKQSIFAPEFVRGAARASVRKLSPRDQARNPVMFVVYVGTALTLYLTAANLVTGRPWGYELAVTVLLLLTVLFANFAEGLAEARGKA